MFRPRVKLALLALVLTAPMALLGQSTNFIPQGFEALGQRAAFHTDFTFDRAMLQVAGYFVGDGDQETRNAIAKLNSITVHSYHFASPGLYDPGSLELIRRQYEAAGWKHLRSVNC